MSGFLRKFSVVCSLSALACGGGNTEPSTVGPPQQLAIVTQPDGGGVGVALAQQPVIEVRDQYGRLVDTATTLIRAEITAGVGARPASLNGETIVRAVGGIAHFADLTITGVTGKYSIRFTAGTLASATSGLITVGCGAPASVELYTQTYTGAPGVVLLPGFELKLRDACGDMFTSFSNWNVTAALSSGGGSLSGTTAKQGYNTATFSDLVITGAPGPRRLRFTFAKGTESVSVESATIQLNAP